MRALLPWLFWSSICAAFLLNFLFLGAEALAWARRCGPKRALGALLLLIAAFGLWAAAFRGVSPRGGYDNEHDISLLCMSALGGSGPEMLMHNKEASPLFMVAVADALSGFSLGAVLSLNRLLMFASGVMFFLCALRAGLGLPAALLAFVLYSFSFLAGLNANTLSTTPANMFFLFSALFAAVSMEAGRSGLRGLAWALAAFFLVWTSRYELAVFPAMALLFSLVSPSGEARALLADPRRRAAALALAGLTAALCLAWAAAGISPAGYNGPSLSLALRLFENLAHHLDARNLAQFFPAASGLAGWAVLLALAASLYGAARSGRRAGLAWVCLAAACVYTSAVFTTRDLYPLHFMRHQLYFSVPFAALFSAAAASLPALRFPRAAASFGRPLLAAVCAAFIYLNAAAAARLEPESRTNDQEWRLLLEAAGKWPEGCFLLYPGGDNRGLLLGKYFPTQDLRSGVMPSCLLKYVPPSASRFLFPGTPPPQEYNPFSGVYAGAADRPFAEKKFLHKFYTVWDGVETREEFPVRAGFYPADSAVDKAWVLNEGGLWLLARGSFPQAERNFREAASLYPGCDVCGLNLAACLLAQGRNGEALAEARKARLRAGGSAEELLAGGLEAAASGDLAGARRNFGAAQGFGRSGRFPDMAGVYLGLPPLLPGGGR